MFQCAECDVRMRGALGDQREPADERVDLFQAVADEIEGVVVLEQRFRVALRLNDAAGVPRADAVAAADLLPGQPRRPIRADRLISGDLLASLKPGGHEHTLAGSAAGTSCYLNAAADWRSRVSTVE